MHGRGNKDRGGSQKPMDEKWIKERASPPGDEAKQPSAENAAERFQLRFSDVGNSERNGLNDDRIGAANWKEREQKEPAEDEFPSKQVQSVIHD